MISIYTRSNNILKKEFWKYSIKKMLGKYSGPDAVLDSLTRGLSELGIPYEVNPAKPKYNVIHVLSGIEILKKMIQEKSIGKIKTLVAGPTLVQTPYDHDGIIQSKQIDLILFPSHWTKDFYVSLVPTLEKNIKIWPAGVSIPEKTSNKGKILIFKKNIPEDTYNQIIKNIKDKDIPYDIISYGTFSKKEYYKKLESTSVLIYLQTSESQGLALQEAWAYDVPTLVWKSTMWKTDKYSWTDENISAPYLTNDSGSFFTLDTLSTELEKIIKNVYAINPRKYCIDNLSNKASAKKYLEIIKHYVK